MAEKPESFEVDLGRAVKSFRVSRGLTQEDLAEKVGVDRKTITRIENGKHSTRVSTLFHISQALEVHPSEFLK